MVITKCVFLNLPIKTLSLVRYPAIFESELMKMSCLVPRLVPYNNSKHKMNQYILSTEQAVWNGVVENKLHSVKPVLGD